MENHLTPSIDETQLEHDWDVLLGKLATLIGKKPTDLNAVLFLIGVQELGQGAKHFTKEQKQDLMHIAICKLLSQAGMYELEGLDAEGWPHWKLVNKIPHLNLGNQEKTLKSYALQYFKELGIGE